MKKQVYTITIEHNEDGTKKMTRRNDGFNPLELLGILKLTQQDIVNQIRSAEEPDIDIVKRELVED